MSRSIHSTRRTLRRAARDAEARKAGADEKLKKVRREKWRKYLIKRYVRSERSQPTPPFGGADPMTIPIEVLDESEHVKHGAGKEDVQAVLSRLPHAVRDGISRIQLALGKAYQIEKMRRDGNDDPACDPITERPGTSLIQGVYCGNCLGVFSPATGLIRVFAYVCDWPQVPLPRPALDLYLRLQALATLVHEVAHHHDESARVKRGRWLADRKENVENYAERMEYKWTHEIVVPYLRSSYPDETEALLSWIEHHGGIRLELERFVDDPRTTQRNGLYRLIFDVADAVRYWLRDFSSYSTLADLRFGFAEELHYADQYPECLAILNDLLQSDPLAIKLLTFKADTLVHLKRLDEAAEIVSSVLERVPGCEEAWEVQGDILEEKREWLALLENCEQWLSRVPLESKRRSHALMHKTIAYCALGHMEATERGIAELLQACFMKNAVRLRKAVFRRAGKQPE